MDRRQFLNRAGMFVAGTFLSSGFVGCATGSQDKPNIIFIMADDLGYADLGCYGQDKIRTPNIDSIAAEGIRFTDCYAGAAVCAPSRSTIITGQHTGHTRIRGNRSQATDNRIPLLPEDPSIASVLQNAGYTTGIIGKWGLGEPGTTGIPAKKGFDHFFGFLNQRNAHTYYPPFVWRNQEKVILEGNQNGQRNDYVHDSFTEEALSFVEENRNEPFFLYLPYTIPHLELAVPEDSLNEYKGQFPEIPYTDDHYADQTHPRAAYAAMIARMDRDIGKIMDLLDTHGLTEDTLIFFTSDNGPNDRDGVTAEFFNNNGPFRGYKGELYEGGIRVPMVAKWPGKIPEGVVNNTPWAFWDLLPTFAELAGAEHPEQIDGISMISALQNEPQESHEYFYWETTSSGFTQAVRMGDWKAIWVGIENPVELYNLAEDISESNNIAADHPDIVAKATELFTSARTPSKHWPMPAAAES